MGENKIVEGDPSTPPLFIQKRYLVTYTDAKPTYLQALQERVLVFDGAMGTSIDTFDLTAEDYGGERTNGNRDYLVITRPDVIAQIHATIHKRYITPSLETVFGA